MLEGLFKYCNWQRLRNVNIGGLCMDVKDRAEMQACRGYVEPLTEARRAHYHVMVRETLHDSAHMREEHLPVEDHDMWLDFYHGQTYWRVGVEDVSAEVAAYAAI